MTKETSINDSLIGVHPAKLILKPKQHLSRPCTHTRCAPIASPLEGCGCTPNLLLLQFNVMYILPQALGT